MKWGVNICSDVGRWHATLAQAKLAEELGIDSVWLPEHHLDSYLGSPLTALAGISCSTQRVLLGTDVAIAPLYQPIRLAEETAQVQEMSNGRLILGLAIGYRESEFDAFGVDIRRRGVLLEECLRVVRGLWSGEGKGSATTGTSYPLLIDALPSIPIWLGGWAERAVRRAARLGDAWFPGPTAHLDAIGTCLQIYDDELAKTGNRRAELPIFREVWVADNRSDYEYGVRTLEDFYGSHYAPFHENVPQDDEASEGRFILGNPDEVAEQILRLTKVLGVTHMICRLHVRGRDSQAVEKSMELLASRVRPEVDREISR